MVTSKLVEEIVQKIKTTTAEISPDQTPRRLYTSTKLPRPPNLLADKRFKAASPPPRPPIRTRLLKDKVSMRNSSDFSDCSSSEDDHEIMMMVEKFPPTLTIKSRSLTDKSSLCSSAVATRSPLHLRR